ncbi:MAG: hypothetical protein ACKPKO_39810 [Candidatus Fonsibacter sp.]
MRTVVDLEDTDNYCRPPYAQFKLDLAYHDDAPAFKVYDKSDGVGTEVVLKSFEEALQYIRYMTKHRIVINFSKLCAMKTSSGNDKKKYGIALKAIGIECLNKTAPQSNPCSDLFDDEQTTTWHKHTNLPIPLAPRGRRNSK